jgi:hypothetical protein
MGKFSTNIQSSSDLEIAGLNMEYYYDKKKKECYALAVTDLTQLTDFNSKKIVRLRSQIENHLSIGQSYEQSLHYSQALSEYLACYPLFRKLEKAHAVLSVSKTNIVFSELDHEFSIDENIRNKITHAIARVETRSVKSLNDLAWHLTYMLKKQLDPGYKNVMVTHFTYQDTRFGSPFSRYFKPLLEKELIENTDWNIVQHQIMNFQPKTRDIFQEFAIASNAEFVLRGNYWESAKNIKFIVNIHEVLTGELVASAEKDIAGNIIKETGRIMKPENFEQAYSDRLEFLRDEVISGGLMLEAWTNKGNENLIYTKGETLTVNVRVNMPSYIRFIYHLADGSRVLLLNNYYINQSKVNQVYPVPKEFVCASPFGAEFLQVFAQTEEFEKLAIEDIDGYTILKEDLAKFLTKTRGFKKKKPELMQTENRLIITTMEE